MTNNDSYAASMCHVVHLIHVWCNEKGLLNFVSERVKLVYRMNLLGRAFNTLTQTAGIFYTSHSTDHNTGHRATDK